MKLKKDLLLRMLIVFAFLLISATSIAFSAYLMFMAHGNAELMVLAGLFLAISLISVVFNFTIGMFYYNSFFYSKYQKKILAASLKGMQSTPSVAVVLLAYNEDPGIIKTNYAELLKMDYPKSKLHFFLSDDSTKTEISEQLKEFCSRNRISYIHRKKNTNFKAGALNNFLKHSKDDLIAIFDYDEYLKDKNFLKDLIPYFGDKSVSFVQTQKRYSKGSLFSDSVDLFDAFFFHFIQPARAINNTAIFAGSCGIIRRSALDRIGGFPNNVIEDTFFSFESDIHNYRGVFTEKIYAIGKPITKFSALVKQQIRYNYGDNQFLSYVVRSKKAKKLPFASKLDYISHGFGLNYLSVMLLLFTVLSIFVVFYIPFVKIPPQDLFNLKMLNYKLELLGLFGFTISLLFPVILTKIYFKSLKKGLMIFLLNFSLVIIRTKAAVYALFNKNIDLWSRSTIMPDKTLTQSIRLTKLELSFSSVLFILGAFAIYKSIIYGGIFLIWYGFMYVSATILFYKYG
ncbi:MAG: glycosyltransferase [Candidatus Marsarchaeota archaeon]|nr:glycosyltransferase [Candidatus Marsarchaeota archaeon]MCL5106002.1 glycosyltransferase [Candidatus Marsarchaeota archaeon]